MVRSPIFRGTPTQSMDGGPISSTSPLRSSSACTSGVTSNGRPVRSTYSVNPLPGRLVGKSWSYSSTKYGNVRRSLDASSDLLTFPYFVDEYDQDFPTKRPGKGLTEYVLRTGRPLLVTPEVQAELERSGEVELIGPPSIDWVGVPLKIGDRTIGVLVAQTYAPGVRYGETEKHILQFVSTQVAMAIERRRTAEQLLESERKYRLLFETNPEPMFVYDFETLS